MFVPHLQPPRHSIGKLALAIAVSGLLVSSAAVARSQTAQPPLPAVALAALPAEARHTDEQIRKGGPFAHAKDGSVFGNREKLLPTSSRGYYREYTVKTPGAPDRGARRIVCGGSQPTTPEACYYTGDHYASFARIVR